MKNKDYLCDNVPHGSFTLEVVMAQVRLEKVVVVVNYCEMDYQTFFETWSVDNNV